MHKLGCIWIASGMYEESVLKTPAWLIARLELDSLAIRHKNTYSKQNKIQNWFEKQKCSENSEIVQW